MLVIGRGPSARALRTWGIGRRGVVNWSGTDQSVQHPGCLNQYTTTNKLRQLQDLRAADVPTVNFSPTPLDTASPPWYARTLRHQQGRDFTRQVRGDFWTEPTPSKAEFRCHVFRRPGGVGGYPGDYNVVRIGWKVYVGEGEPANPPIRNRRFGWRLTHYATPDNCPHDKLKTLAKWAVAVLDWDFGAVDVLRKPDGSFVVLEVNSCPGLRDEITLNTYTQNIAALLEG